MESIPIASIGFDAAISNAGRERQQVAPAVRIVVPICIGISDDIGVSWSAVYIMIVHVYTYPQSISVIIVKSLTSLNALLMRIPKPTKTVDKGTR